MIKQVTYDYYVPRTLYIFLSHWVSDSFIKRRKMDADGLPLVGAGIDYTKVRSVLAFRRHLFPHLYTCPICCTSFERFFYDKR